MRSPATDTARLRVAVAPRPAAAGRRPFTVLCVEDNHANQLLVQRLLARRPDVRLLLAGDGQYGVQRAHEMQPDVVLMDINLPGQNGPEAMEDSKVPGSNCVSPHLAPFTHVSGQAIFNPRVSRLRRRRLREQ